MANSVIQLENVSKQYRLGNVDTFTFHGDMKRLLARILGKEDPFLQVGQENILDKISKNKNSEYVWALKDINLEVKEGEVLGIIGKNGAGKSTLLKLMSRVTAPTTGNIKIRGRIASLLEVGTGFHPDLTGKENIFLNGAILGMTKSEIKSKFDEIVDFSGVEKYIDTPVKRYSSGMYVRLAFAVAAHLDPEILIVDEVLAVGDAEFQKKALGKMQGISKEGRTVLFVSHNMQAIKSLCKSGIQLKNGLVFFKGDINSCVSSYLSGDTSLLNLKKSEYNAPFIKLPEIEIFQIGIKAVGKEYEDIISIEDELLFTAIYKQNTAEKEYHLTLHLKDENGNKIFSTGAGKSNLKGTHTVTILFPSNFFNWGNFSIDLYIIENRQNGLYFENDIIGFTILNKASELGSWMGKEPGAIHPSFKWTNITE